MWLIGARAHWPTVFTAGRKSTAYSAPPLLPLSGRAVIAAPTNFSPPAPAKRAVTMSAAPTVASPVPAMTALDLDHDRLIT